MRFRFLSTLFFLAFSFNSLIAFSNVNPIRILIITGGHSYNVDEFNQMFESLGENISYQIEELPDAYKMFLPENRRKYDVLVFYHMWQTITKEESAVFEECIREGKPLVVLHHSICAYDDWPEYINIIGGKYFHKPTFVNGKKYPPCSYIHDLHFIVKIIDPTHPVTQGIRRF